MRAPDARRFRKRPVVIEAWQVTDDTFDVPHPNPAHPVSDAIVYDPVSRTVTVRTLEGVMLARTGDWIIRGVRGELYPCKPDIFAATYEDADAPVEASALEQMRAQRDEARNLLTQACGKNTDASWTGSGAEVMEHCMARDAALAALRQTATRLARAGALMFDELECGGSDELDVLRSHACGRCDSFVDRNRSARDAWRAALSDPLVAELLEAPHA